MKEEGRQKPAIIGWINGFCIFSGILNLAVGVFGIAMSLNVQGYSVMLLELMGATTDDVDLRDVGAVIYTYGLILGPTGLIFGPLNFWLAYAKPNPWLWVMHAVNLLAAALSCICLPIAAPLMFFWFKPEVREYFEFR